MTAARKVLSEDEVVRFKWILDNYRTKTNPVTGEAKRESKIMSLLSNQKGKERLKTFDTMLATLAKNDYYNIDREAFFKQMSAYAYAEYENSWTKQSDGLCASVMRFIGEELKQKKKHFKAVHFASYGPAAYRYTQPEEDGDYFKRINEILNPAPKPVEEKQLPAVCYNYGMVRAGIPFTGTKVDSGSHTPAIQPRAGFPVILR